MISKLLESLAKFLDSSFVLQWVVMLLILIYVLSKCLPPIVSAFNKARNKVNYGENIIDMVRNHESKFQQVDQKLERDYREINTIKAEQFQMKIIQKESLEERALIMESLLAIIEGLNEAGSTESTKEVQKKLHKYLNQQAHQD